MPYNVLKDEAYRLIDDVPREKLAQVVVVLRDMQSLFGHMVSSKSTKSVFVHPNQVYRTTEPDPALYCEVKGDIFEDESADWEDA